METLIALAPKGFSLLGMVMVGYWAWSYLLLPLMTKLGGFQAVESKAFTDLKAVATSLEARVKSLEATVSAPKLAPPPGVPQPPTSPGG